MDNDIGKIIISISVCIGISYLLFQSFNYFNKVEPIVEDPIIHIPKVLYKYQDIEFFKECYKDYPEILKILNSFHYDVLLNRDLLYTVFSQNISGAEKLQLQRQLLEQSEQWQNFI